MADDKKYKPETATSGIFTLDPEDLVNGIPGVTSLLSVKRDGKKIRNDRSFEKDYIQGNYGAIPFIGNINSLLKDKNTARAKKLWKDGKKDQN